MTSAERELLDAIAALLSRHFADESNVEALITFNGDRQETFRWNGIHERFKKDAMNTSMNIYTPESDIS